MRKLRVGILGVSQIAERYGIPAFRSLPDVELVAIASRSAEKAQQAAARHTLEPESYESLITRDDIDVIYSPLPIGLQEEWVLKIAAAKKHIICEKSITFSLESARRMVEACRKEGVALYENFVPEFHPQHAAILAAINDGRIGVPHEWRGVYGFPPFPEGDIRYRADLKGGALNDAGCYTTFMARKIMQQEPRAVTCALRNDGHDVDIAGSALLEFEHGTALMSFGFDHLYQNTYAVWGSKGIIRTNRAFAIPPTLAPTVELITNDGTKEISEAIDAPAANQFALSFGHFCAAVTNGEEEKIGDMYDRVLCQAGVLDAMRISARDGVRVML